MQDHPSLTALQLQNNAVGPRGASRLGSALKVRYGVCTPEGGGARPARGVGACTHQGSPAMHVAVWPVEPSKTLRDHVVDKLWRPCGKMAHLC